MKRFKIWRIYIEYTVGIGIRGSEVKMLERMSGKSKELF